MAQALAEKIKSSNEFYMKENIYGTGIGGVDL